jgi:hypothetical protein
MNPITPTVPRGVAQCQHIDAGQVRREVTLHGTQHHRVVEDEPEGRNTEQSQGECREDA